MIRSIIEKPINEQLSYKEVREASEEIMTGKVDDINIGAFLAVLRIRGEEVDILRAVYDAMLKYAITIRPQINGRLIDTCGTGGDKLRTFNISTAAAFVASVYTYVAKHGNRSSRGYAGSADILEALGYNLKTEPNKIKESIEQLRIGFLFAPLFHPAMRYVSTARRALGIRTIFNILGPIANPCNIDAQIVGVSELSLMQKIIELLKLIGRREAMVFHSINGIDELSISSINRILWLKDGINVKELSLDPKTLGIMDRDENIIINSKEEAITAFLNALNGYDKAKSNIVSLNAAAALIVANMTKRFDEALEMAREAINNGKAYEQLRSLIKRYGDYSKLEELEKTCLS